MFELPQTLKTKRGISEASSGETAHLNWVPMENICVSVAYISNTSLLHYNYFTAYSLQIICKHNKKRLNEYLEDEMVEEKCGFRKGRRCTDAIFTVQQIMEKRK